MACSGSPPTFNVAGGQGVITKDANCKVNAYAYIDAPCGSSGYSLVIYRSQGSSPTYTAGEIIYSGTIPDGPQSGLAFPGGGVDDTPPCVRGTYYYGFRIECSGAVQSTAPVRQTDFGGPASITASTCTLNEETCVVSNSVQISKPCGECAGTGKLFRNGIEVYSGVVPAGPLVGFTLSHDETPADGTWSYIWKIYADTAIEDAESALHTVSPLCSTYNPFTTPLPEGQMEKQLVLVQVVRTGPETYSYTDIQVLNLEEQRIEWWQHKNGGCGSFRLLTHEDFGAIFDDIMADSWEVHVRIKLGGEYTHTTWYRGIIRSLKTEYQGQELFTELRGYGYVELLDNIQVQHEYPAGMTVKQIVDDIIDVYIKPNSRIVRPNDIDVTNLDTGVDDSSYVTNTPIYFECSALKAIKLLAELQGTREFGVDAHGAIYFKASSSVIGKNFFLSNDILQKVDGGKTFIEANDIKVAGKALGGKNFLLNRQDITDVSNTGLYESTAEVPWLSGDVDAARWADNIIAKHKISQTWSTFTWKNVDENLTVTRPIDRIKVYGTDVSNDVKEYEIAKIQFVEGGWITKQEIREMGSPTIQPELDQQIIKATLFVGYYPRDIIEELQVRIVDQIDALKGREKQFRYPRDYTNLPTTGNVPGEIISYAQDVTNNDVINNSSELQDITNPRGLDLAWLDKQWNKLSTRRTFRSLPARGKFIGEIVSLITDVTNSGFGVLYWWDGTTWNLMGTSSGGGGGGGGGVSLSDSNPTTIQPDDTASPGVGATASRYDHRHAIATDVAVDITNTNAEGVSVSFSRADHQHRGTRTVKIKGLSDIDGYTDVTAVLPLKLSQNSHTITIDANVGIPVDVTEADAQGTATSFALSDHRHKGVLSVEVKGQTPINGYVDVTCVPPLKAAQSGHLITLDVDDVYIRRDGTKTFTGNQSLGGQFRFTDVTNPQSNYDLATKKYVDDLITTVSGTTPIALQYRRPKVSSSFLASTLAAQDFGATGVSLTFTIDESQNVKIEFGGSVQRTSGAAIWKGAMGFRITCASPSVDSTYSMPREDFHSGAGDDIVNDFGMAGHKTLNLAAGTYTVYLHWGRIDSDAHNFSLLGSADGYEAGITVQYTNIETAIGYSSNRSARLYNYERLS